jgi:hypothetical protein
MTVTICPWTSVSKGRSRRRSVLSPAAVTQRWYAVPPLAALTCVYAACRPVTALASAAAGVAGRLAQALVRR